MADGDVWSWADLRSDLGPAATARARRGGELVRVFPRAWALAPRGGEADVRLRAALLTAGPQAALSHGTGLLVHGLGTGGEAVDDAVHVSVGLTSGVRGAPGLVVHRRPEPILGRRTTRSGLAVLDAATCVLDVWAQGADDGCRAVVLSAVRRRLVRVSDLQTALGGRRTLPQRRQLDELLRLLDLGCTSELELWGFARVFDHPDLPPMVGQFEVRDGGRVARLDRAHPATKTAVELDGAAYHGSREQREHDVCRDAWLATLGWLVIRVTHRRLHREPARVREEIRRVIAARSVAL